MKFWKSLTCTAIAALGLAGAAQAQPKVVISQVYPGAGCASAGCSQYQNDYVEIFNAGNAPQDLTGWSVQYASATNNTFSSKVDLTGTIQPGEYRLLSGGGNANGTLPLPANDGINTSMNMAAGGGKILLASTTTLVTLSTCTAATLVDLVGYGTATCFEGAVAPAPGSNFNAIFRANNGCTDSGSNAADFAAAAAAPRNSATTAAPCTTNVGPTGATSVDQSPVCPGTTVTFTVTVTPGTPAVAIATVTGDFTAIGGGASESFANVPPASNTWTKTIAIPTNNTTGSKSIPVVITESGASPRVANSSGSITISNCTLGLTTGTGFTPSAVCSGSAVTFTAIVRKNTINPPGTSTGISVVLDLTNVNNFAPLSMPMNDDGDYPNPGDNQRKFTLTHIVPAGQLSGSGSVGITLTDAQGNVPTLNPFNVTLIGPCTPSTSTVVISQVYGGGGNLDAPFQRDFVELFNRSSSPVDISGWSLQYAGATAAFNSAFAIPAGSIVQPGQYFLIGAGVGSSCAGSTPCGVPLPVSVDADGSVLGSIGSQEGKLILLSGVTAALGTGSDVCPVPVPGGGTIQDFIGYGGANCREGLSNAASLSNTTAAFRRNGGCQDNDQSAADFTTGTPAPRNSASPTNSCFTPTTDNCCRGTTCNSVTAGSCTGVVAGSNSIVVTSCGAGTAFATCCFADFNHDGIQSIDDLFLYFNAYFTASPWANMGGNGVDSPTIDDLFLYINAYFGTCAP